MAFTGVGTQSRTSSYSGQVDEFSDGFAGGDLQFQVSRAQNGRHACASSLRLEETIRPDRLASSRVDWLEVVTTAVVHTPSAS
jgi:hypothetical protein